MDSNQDSHQESKRTLLILDDDPFFISGATRIFREAGFNVHSCDIWAQVAGAINRVKPDLVLVDYHMPSLKGDKIVSVLKDGGRSLDFKVVMFSAEKEEVLARVAKECGADGYIPKSLPAHRLIEEVDSYISSASDEPVTAKGAPVLGKVLVVDRSSFNRRVIGNVIRRNYYARVIESTSAKEAVEILSREPGVDLFIIDINGPAAENWKLFEAIGKAPANYSARIIITSEKDRDLDVLRGMTWGANKRVLRPFAPETLIRAVDRLLEERPAKPVFRREGGDGRFREAVPGVAK